jgi:hypothetical protein
LLPPAVLPLPPLFNASFSRARARNRRTRR